MDYSRVSESDHEHKWYHFEDGEKCHILQFCPCGAVDVTAIQDVVHATPTEKCIHTVSGRLDAMHDRILGRAMAVARDGESLYEELQTA